MYSDVAFCRSQSNPRCCFHRRRRGDLPAARVFLRLGLLLLIAWSAGCGREETLPESPPAPERSLQNPTGAPMFVDVTEAWGLHFQHAVGGERTYFFPEIMSPGAAFLDYDLDGDLDVYLVNTGQAEFGEGRSESNPAGTASSRLFRQESVGRFVDVTELSGLGNHGYGMGVAIGDVNNDGWPDIYLTNHGPDRLYLNQRNGTFADVTEAAGIDNERWSASAAFVDYDRDGWLDLFVANYVDYQPGQPCLDPGGRLDYCNPAMFPPTADTLYRNLTGRTPANAPDTGSSAAGEVRFEDVSVTSGIATRSGAGLGVICADLTGDGWADLYVANDGHANRLWVNQHNGTFRDEAVLRGVAYDAVGRAQGGMGTALGDLNDDGVLDIVVTNLEGESNAVYLSSGDEMFHDSCRSVGIFEPSLPLTGFGVALVDFEQDGDLDLAVVNGRVRSSRGTRVEDGASGHAKSGSFWDAYVESNQLFLNNGQGQFALHGRFDEPFAAGREVSRALACGDVDNDGDVDLLVTNTAGAARLFLNNAPKPGHWLSVRVVDPALGGRDAYGAGVTVEAAGRQWRRAAVPGTSYLSSHDPRVHFGLGSATAVDRITIRWPDGLEESFPGGGVDRFVVVERGRGPAP